MAHIKSLVSAEYVDRRIYILRGHRVLLDRDLAEMYDVPTRRLNEQVKRNPSRFPPDFMFRLNKEEMAKWRSQIATSNSKGTMGIRRPAYAFTEQGIAMLSSVLNSERAILVNVGIMRSFVQLRNILASHQGLARMLDELEQKYDAQFKVVFDAIREFTEPPTGQPPREIGFKPD